MAPWKVPKEDAHPKKPEPPTKPHRPPHEATYEGLAHISQQIDEVMEAVKRIENKVDRQ
jgi:hypothetical protein